MLASRYDGTLDAGVTSKGARCLAQHRAGIFDGCTKRYAVVRRVYFEIAESLSVAIS